MTSQDELPSVADHNAAVLAAAHRYIERGWFPLALHGVIDLPGGGTACTCSKGADPDHLGSQGKHPLSTKWTSQDVPDLAPFSRELPTNLGIVTGNKSGFFVIDVDTTDGWRDLQAMGELTPTYTVKTGGGGFQLYYQMPPGMDITNRDKTLPKGVDVRGNGGMVVVPPSRSGKGPYAVKHDLPVNPGPGWLLDALTKPAAKAPSAKPVPQADRLAPGPQVPAQARPQTRREAKYETTIIDGEVQRLLDLPQPWHEGARWDATIFEVSCQLVELANARWSNLTLEEAHLLVTENAPRDGSWDEAKAKFASARTTVGDKARLSPTVGEDPDDPFSPGYVAPSGNGYVPPGPGTAARTRPTQEHDELWNARPVLAHIRDFARARRCSPWAALGVTLARTCTAIPPFVVLPPSIGSYASLNIFVALEGPSGAGKDAATGAAKDAMDVGPITTAGLGSGEGIAHQYVRYRPPNVKTGDSGGLEQHTKAVLFTVAEVDTLAALVGRQASTTAPELRKTWMGDELGFAYVDKEKRLRLDAHSYRLCLLVGVQPERAGVLLDGAAAGTPQRFVWLPALDPDAPDIRPAEPPPWTRPRFAWPLTKRADGLTALQVCPTAAAAVDAGRLGRLRGDGDALDGHSLLARLKVAALLGILDGRAEAGEEDWHLAGIIMAKSDATRATVTAALAAVQRRGNLARGVQEGERSVIVTETVEKAAVKRVGRLLLAKLDGTWTPGAPLRRALPGRDRPHFEAAMEHLIGAGQVEGEATDNMGPDGVRYRLAGSAS